MSSANFCTCVVDLADDAVENEFDDIVVPGGKNFAQLIAQHIQGSTQPVQHSFYGWSFTFPMSNSRKGTVLIQHPSDWLIIVTANTSWLLIGRRRQQYIDEAIAIVDQTLSMLPFVKAVQWSTQSEYLKRLRVW